MENKAKKKKYKSRILAAVIYCVIAIVLFIVSISSEYFPFEFKIGNYQLIWCIACTCLGFVCLTLDLISHSPVPQLRYFAYYPPLILVISSLVFGILNLFEKTSGTLFYYFSFSICFILGLMVDWFSNFIIRIIEGLLGKTIKP